METLDIIMNLLRLPPPYSSRVHGEEAFKADSRIGIVTAVEDYGGR